MFIFNYAVLIGSIIIVVIALYYTRLQFAGNKEIVNRFKDGATQAPGTTSGQSATKQIDG